jgi:hypothetical protein
MGEVLSTREIIYPDGPRGLQFLNYTGDELRERFDRLHSIVLRLHLSTYFLTAATQVLDCLEWHVRKVYDFSMVFSFHLIK